MIMKRDYYEAAFRAEFPLVNAEVIHLRPWVFEIHIECADHTKKFWGRRWKEVHFRWRMPYGMWTTADGREILFNRDYQPIWQRRPGCTAKQIEPQWIDYVKERWFFDDGNPPWFDDSTRRMLDDVLARFHRG